MHNKLLITGSDTIYDSILIRRNLEDYFTYMHTTKDVIILTGYKNKVEVVADIYAYGKNIPVIYYEQENIQNRNMRMLTDATAILLLWNGYCNEIKELGELASIREIPYTILLL